MVLARIVRGELLQRPKPRAAASEEGNCRWHLCSSCRVGTDGLQLLARADCALISRGCRLPCEFSPFALFGGWLGHLPGYLSSLDARTRVSANINFEARFEVPTMPVAAMLTDLSLPLWHCEE